MVWHPSLSGYAIKLADVYIKVVPALRNHTHRVSSLSTRVSVLFDGPGGRSRSALPTCPHPGSVNLKNATEPHVQEHTQNDVTDHG